MEYGAIDLHTQDSQIRIVTEAGTVVLDRRIRTRADRFAAMFGDRAPMRILLETGTESEWVAQCLEALGHVVVVADPNYAAMYGTRIRRIKTDRRDVAALAEANRRGVYRATHRASATAQALRRQLQVRAHLVTVRTGLINLVRAHVRAAGYRVPSGTAETTGRRIARLDLPATLQERSPRSRVGRAAAAHCGGRSEGARDGHRRSDCAAVANGTGHRPDHRPAVSGHGR